MWTPQDSAATQREMVQRTVDIPSELLLFVGLSSSKFDISFELVKRRRDKAIERRYLFIIPKETHFGCIDSV